jgi:sigma-B regulation protein RsbU (phosphoserine phosphatase)
VPVTRAYDVQLRLLPGDTLVLYTDGVTEARCGKAFYGEERLAATVARRFDSAQALTSAILTEVLDFQTGQPRDDIVIVAIRVPL